MNAVHIIASYTFYIHFDIVRWVASPRLCMALIQFKYQGCLILNILETAQLVPKAKPAPEILGAFQRVIFQ
jgi:hypothetical protein